MNNPWSSDCHSPIQRLLEEAPPSVKLCHRTQPGHHIQIGQEIAESIRLSNRLHQLTVECEHIRQYDAHSGTISPNAISAQIETVRQLSDHLRFILDHKQALRSRLAQPIADDAIIVEEKYHRILCDLMRDISQSDEAWSSHDDSFYWAIDEARHRDQDRAQQSIDRLNRCVVICQRYLDAIIQMRTIIAQYADID